MVIITSAFYCIVTAEFPIANHKKIDYIGNKDKKVLISIKRF